MDGLVLGPHVRFLIADVPPFTDMSIQINSSKVGQLEPLIIPVNIFVATLKDF